MAVKSKEELLKAVKEIIGGNTGDASISLLEDMSDTLSGLSDAESWKKKYEENDKAWREKYMQRFFEGGEPDKKEDPPEPEKKEPTTFEELFTPVT